MKSNNVNKEQWVAMFRDIGLDDATMKRWHQMFETRNPEGHQEFLEWLSIPSSEITEIRSL
ncbi:MAG: hypothetical protein KZQ75_05390 [Candidatus Thiodiazotropha sp. (ex Myrtea spinifera)]|nr:hypothetical protein [Candidatus Thiodiazotropha sp. (ex Myrtea spinifera)]MCU7827990.1 hypothetical protein [Candidatus Thiodiazotropha sp. (ex Myrtea sp. 'scaly one' KF741663)]